MTLPLRPEAYLKYTRSTCPVCRRLVDTDVYVKDSRVYFRKHCPEHGVAENLVASDAEWYLDAYKVTRPGFIPKKFGTIVDQGCPHDCGLCTDHLQHTCLPIVEITDHCDLACPICLVETPGGCHMTKDDFTGIVDTLVECEGQVSILNISGGEPTTHPHLLEFLALARQRNGINRISVNTNGLRIAGDPEFVRQLADIPGLYITLQFDGFSDDIYRTLRGKDLLETKYQALEVLKENGINTTLAFTAVKGVNDHELGRLIDFVYENDQVLSLMIQPAAYCGSGIGTTFNEFDPMDVLTIPEIHQKIEEQTGGTLKRSDFSPLPCSHPHCFSLTYLLKLKDGGYVPYPRFVDLENYLDIISNKVTIEVDGNLHQAMQDTIYSLYSASGITPNSEAIIQSIKESINDLFNDPDRSCTCMSQVAEEKTKTIFIHAFMDEYTFDLERVKKCCDQYPQTDGRLIPCCVFNVLRRRRPR